MFEGRTRETLKAGMMADLNSSTGLSTLEGGFADQVFGPVAVELEKIYMTMDAVLDVLAVDGDSGWLLDIVAGNFAITRKEGVRARASVTFSGTEGAIVPAGTVCTTQSGLVYVLDAAVYIGASGSGSGVLVADEVGTRYNVSAGVIDQTPVSITGVTGFSAGEATGGVDRESDASLCARYYDKLRRPTTSSNPNDYRKWAMETPGVGEAKVIPLVNGPGTVGVTLVSGDYGPVDATVVAAALANVEKNRAVGLDKPPAVRSATALPLNISIVSKLETSLTPNAAKAAFEAALAAYCKELVREKYARVYDGPEDDLAYTLSYNRVATLFMTIPGVIDYTSLTINGGAGDVPIDKDAVPVVGEVTVT